MSLADIKHLNPASVLDCGANCGHWYSEAKSLWPNASFFLIEGNEACRPAIEALNVPFKIAYLGDMERDVQFYKRKGGSTDTGNSYYRELTPFFADDQIEVETVKLVRLGSLCLPQPDFIKIDTQGSELDVIRGGLELCKGAKHILMEVAIEPYNQSAPLWGEVLSFMRGIGFNEWRGIGDICHPLDHKRIVQRDVLFSR